MLEDKITDWITKITKEGDLPKTCQAIYIGLFEGKKGYMINFVGSVDFDAEDTDWACDEEDDYFPKNRYLESGVTTETDYESFQNDVVSIIKKLRDNKKLILSQAKNIAVGFDDGDLEYI